MVRRENPGEVYGFFPDASSPGGRLAAGTKRGEREKMAKTRRNFYRKSSKKKAAARTYRAVCAQCGKEVLLEVPPTGNDLLCLDCYNKK